MTRRFPAEWEHQKGILLCFPHNGNDWPGKYQAVQWAYIEFIKKVTCYETVYLMVASEMLQHKVTGMLQNADVNLERVDFILHKTNRSWMRDSGPIIVQNNLGNREAISFNFNSFWAEKIIFIS